MTIAPSNDHFDGIPHFQTQRVAGEIGLSPGPPPEDFKVKHH